MAQQIHPQRRRAWHERFQRYRLWPGTFATFCQQEDITQATFYYWKKRLDTDLTALTPGSVAESTSGSTTSTAATTPSSDRQARPSSTSLVSQQHPQLFVPISIVSPTEEPGIRIDLPGGAAVHVPSDASAELIRTCIAAETALYHNLGALPEPEFTHEFF